MHSRMPSRNCRRATLSLFRLNGMVDSDMSLLKSTNLPDPTDMAGNKSGAAIAPKAAIELGRGTPAPLPPPPIRAERAALPVPDEQRNGGWAAVSDTYPTEADRFTTPSPG